MQEAQADRFLSRVRDRAAAALALVAGLTMLAVLAATPATASRSTALAATSRYQGASPTHDWGGYRCADTARVVSATYVRSASKTPLGSVQLRYSPKCGTYYAQVFRYGPLHAGYWYSAAIVGGNGSDYYCQYTPPRNDTGGGCYTAMMSRYPGRGYQAKGLKFHGSGHAIVAFGKTSFTTSIGLPGASSKVAAVIQAAESQTGHGYHYAWGAGGKSGPSHGICCSPSGHDDRSLYGYDCSGLTQYAFWHGAHVDVGGSSSVQSQHGRSVPWSQRKPGDLIFWYTSSGHTDHVAIYLGANKMIEAAPPRDSNSVHVTSVYGSHSTVRRILG